MFLVVWDNFLDFHFLRFLLFDFFNDFKLFIILKLFPQLYQQIPTSLKFNWVIFWEFYFLDFILDGFDEIY